MSEKDLKSLLKEAKDAANPEKGARILENILASFPAGPATRDQLLDKLLVLNDLARLYFQMNEPSKGAEKYREILNNSEFETLAGTPAAEIFCGALTNASFAFAKVGKIPEARLAAERAVNLAGEIDSPSLIARTAFNLSLIRYRELEYDEAEKLLLKASEIWRKEGALEQIGHCLNNLGRIYEEKGETEKGIDYHRKAVALRATLPNKTDYAFSLGNLGVALAIDGQLSEAAEKLSESLNIYRALGKDASPDALGFAENLKTCQSLLGEE